MTHPALAVTIALGDRVIAWREKLVIAGYRVIDVPWTYQRFTSGLPRAGVTRTVGRS